jgi:hypothetical protein
MNAAKAIYRIGCFLNPKMASANITPTSTALKLNNKYMNCPIALKKSKNPSTWLNAKLKE